MAKKKPPQPGPAILLQLHHRHPDGALIRYEQRLKGCDVHRWVAEYLRLAPFAMGDSLMVLDEAHERFLVAKEGRR